MYAIAYTAVLVSLDAMTATWLDQEKFIAEVKADIHVLLWVFGLLSAHQKLHASHGKETTVTVCST